MKYVIKKKNKSYKLNKDIIPMKGYKFNPKSKKIRNLIVVNDKLINKIITIKINTMFERLLMIVNDAFNSDDNPSGIVIALDEIALVRGQLLTKYNKYLTEMKMNLYLQKLGLLEEEMKFKMYSLQEKIIHQFSGRGR